MKPESAAYARQSLRQADRDRYLATLVLPDAMRPAITALYAFNAEIAQIPDRAREPAAGEIRLRWWADALRGESHGVVRANPIADALLSVIEEYRLPLPALERLIEARRFDLYQDPMPDVTTFEGYAGDTVSALYQLSAMILNAGQPVEPGDAAGHLGVAHALIGHLRAFGFNASRGRVFLPWSILAAHSVSEQDVLSGHPSQALVDALEQIAEIAGEHLVKAESAIAALPRSLRSAFASAAIVRPQLWRVDLDQPFLAQLDMSDWRKIFALVRWRLRRG